MASEKWKLLRYLTIQEKKILLKFLVIALMKVISKHILDYTHSHTSYVIKYDKKLIIAIV